VKALWAWNLHRPILFCAWFFYQINKDVEIRTCDCLVIKALIPCKRIISIQKLKLLGDVSRYDLYYSLTLRMFVTWIKMLNTQVEKLDLLDNLFDFRPDFSGNHLLPLPAASRAEGFARVCRYPKNWRSNHVQLQILRIIDCQFYLIIHYWLLHIYSTRMNLLF